VAETFRNNQILGKLKQDSCAQTPLRDNFRLLAQENVAQKMKSQRFSVQRQTKLRTTTKYWRVLHAVSAVLYVTNSQRPGIFPTFLSEAKLDAQAAGIV